MKEIYTKTIEFGKVAYNGKKKANLVTIEVTLKIDKNKPIFTSSGLVWNNIKTDCYMSGQCLDSVWTDYSQELINPSLYKKILGLWKRNHLNDMNAGCRHQRAKNMTYDKNKGHVCKVCNYKIGTAWKYKKIEQNDLKEILKILKVEPLAELNILRLNKRIKSE